MANKRAFVNDLSAFLVEHCEDGFRDGKLEGLTLSDDENLLYVNFPGNYTKVINIAMDSNFAIIRDLCKQIDDAPIIDRSTGKRCEW